MISRFCKYIEKVFDFGKNLRLFRDSRQKPQISIGAIRLSAFFMFAMRKGSINAIESELQIPKRMEKIVGKRKPKADIIGNVFAIIETDSLRQILSMINHRLKRNKALKTKSPLIFAAIDGHELFSSRSRCCDKCQIRNIEEKNRTVIEYYHRAVVCHLVGFDLALPLDAELILPGEGEVIAAKRLLERVIKLYPRFFDAIVGDGLYFEAPFINYCIEHGKDVMTVVKSDTRVIMQDALGIIRTQEPEQMEINGIHLKTWDIEGFNSCEGIEVPLRILYVEELKQIRKRKGKKWVNETEQHKWCWVTNIPKSRLPTIQAWKAGHSRWDIENDNFNDLANNWELDHCYKHEPQAIINFILTLFITFILIQSFYHRDLKPPIRKLFTRIAIALQLGISIACENFIAPWVNTS